MNNNAVTFERVPSKFLLMLFIALHAVALVVLWLYTPYILAIPATLCVVLSLATICYQHILLTSPTAILTFGREQDGMWWLRQQSGGRIYGYVMPDTTLSSVISILRFKTLDKTKKYSILLGYDSLPHNYRTFLAHARVKVKEEK